MKKNSIYLFLFIILALSSYFIISSFSHSNLRFSTYISNVETYTEYDKQDFFINYYLTNDDQIFYFDYRTSNKNVTLKKIDKETKQRLDVISLKEYFDNDNLDTTIFFFAESLNYYNIFTSNKLLRYDKKTYLINTYDLIDNYQYLFNYSFDSYYVIEENFIMDNNFNILFEADFNFDKCHYIKDNIFFATSYDNEAFLININDNKLVKLSHTHISYSYDENGIYFTYNQDKKTLINGYDLQGNLSTSFSIKPIYSLSTHSRNNFIYCLEETNKGAKLHIINTLNKKISETIKINTPEKTILNLNQLLISSGNTIYLGTRKTEFDFDLNMQKTVQKLLYFK